MTSSGSTVLASTLSDPYRRSPRRSIRRCDQGAAAAPPAITGPAVAWSCSRRGDLQLPILCRRSVQVEMGGQVVEPLRRSAVRRGLEPVVEIARGRGLIVKRRLHGSSRWIHARRQPDPVGDVIRPLAVHVIRIALDANRMRGFQIPAVERRVRTVLGPADRQQPVVLDRLVAADEAGREPPSAFLVSSS